VAERRQYIRVPHRSLVRLREVHLPPALLDEKEALSRDLSAGGVQVEASRPIPVGTRLSLELQLRDWARRMKEPEAAGFENLPLKLLGEVIHCHEESDKGMYSVGIRFIGLDLKFQKALLQYLRESFEE
jgi:hypothetical protein